MFIRVQSFMRVFPWLRFLAIATLPLPAQLALAAPQPPGCPAGLDLANLSGSWEAQALAAVPAGVAPSRQRLQLQVGADGRVRAQRDWAALNTAQGAVQGRNQAGQPAFAAAEPMIGWINPLSCRVLLVETADSGQMSGWLRVVAGQPLLDLEITQSGVGAVVVMAAFRRQQPSRPGPGTR
ncbi:MAG: hypothetical protein VKL97_02400 [Cyanobacteriota bacterium]|nr:hypothetical protein [Cyanobacteriota bacterium]